MNRRRLLILADYLENNVKENQFDLSFWYRKDKCGTVACAAGWATTIPEFKEAGLDLVLPDKRGYAILKFKGEAGYEALNRFFDINITESLYLFSPNQYKIGTKDEVIYRIRKLVGKSYGGEGAY